MGNINQLKNSENVSNISHGYKKASNSGNANIGAYG